MRSVGRATVELVIEWFLERLGAVPFAPIKGSRTYAEKRLRQSLATC